MIGPVIVHKSNSRFQTESFLAGSKATPDGVWAMFYNQGHAISGKLVSLNAKALHKRATLLRLKDAPRDTEADTLDLQADTMIAASELAALTLEIEGAEDELSHIKGVMERAAPFCRYAGLPLLERLEASQREEWREELKRRVENYLICDGRIPSDEFQTMRMHPDFMGHILPHIQKIAAALPRIHGAKLALPEARAALCEILTPVAIEDHMHG